MGLARYLHFKGHERRFKQRSIMRKSIILTTLALGVVASSAHAFTFTGVGLGSAVSIHGLYNDSSVFAGQLHFNDAAYGHITSYCVDLAHFINVGQTYPVAVLNSKDQAANYKRAGDIVALGSGLVKNNTDAAGLQLAVWKSIYDGKSSSFSSGKLYFSASKSVLDAANKFYCLTGSGNARYFKQVEKGCARPGQGQMQAVPEPTSMIALAAGAAGMIRRRRAAK